MCHLTPTLSPNFVGVEGERFATLPVSRVHPCLSVVENPYRPEMYWCPVSRALNNVRNEGPELIRPAPVQRDLL